MECAVSNRVWHVDAGAENGHGPGAILQSGAVSFAVDSARHTADDSHAGAGEGEPEIAGDSLAITGRFSGADDGDPRAIQDLRIADREEGRRRVGEIEQLARIVRRILRPLVNGERGFA